MAHLIQAPFRRVISAYLLIPDFTLVIDLHRQKRRISNKWANPSPVIIENEPYRLLDNQLELKMVYLLLWNISVVI